MKKSEDIGELAKALSKAQSNYNALIKDSTNPFFKSKYADLAACIECIRAPLVDNGLSIVQTTTVENGVIYLETTLLHSSGQWISSERYPLTPSKNDAQGIGAAMTYARRYSLTAMLGIASEDDDGEVASGRGQAKNQSKQTNHETPAPTAKKNEPTYTKITYSEDTIKKVEKLEKDGYKGKECLKHFLPEYNTKNKTTYKAIAEFTEEKLLDLISFIENKIPSGM